MQLNFNVGNYKLDENEILWEWSFSSFEIDDIDEKIDELLKKHHILFNCPNIWEVERDDEKFMVVHCSLSLPNKKEFKLAVKIDREEFIERYVENGNTTGIPASQFFSSLISTVYMHDNIETFKDKMDEWGLNLVENIRKHFSDNFGLNLLEEAIELIKPTLEKERKHIEEELAKS